MANVSSNETPQKCGERTEAFKAYLDCVIAGTYTFGIFQKRERQHLKRWERSIGFRNV